MARHEIVRLTDDMTGGPADQTVRFGLGPTAYSIDLSHENARAFRESLIPWIAAAKRVGRLGERQGPATARLARGQLDDIRAWAREQGLPVGDRGAIPGDILRAYRERQS